MRADQDSRRTQIVEAAYRCVAERGLPGLRMRDVATAAGVNIATVHYHLSNKDELIRAVVEHAHTLFARDATPPAAPDPATRVRGHLRRLFALLDRDPGLGHVLAELAVEGERDPAVSAAVTAAESRWRTTLAAMMSPLPHRQAAPVAAFIIMAVKGACLPPHDPGAQRSARRELIAWVESRLSQPPGRPAHGIDAGTGREAPGSDA